VTPMAVVLDASVFSALMRGDVAAVRRLVALDPGEVFVPQPTIAEIRYGLARLPRSRRRSALELRARELLATLARAPWTDEVSAAFGTIKADLENRGERLEDIDVAIAAHALATGGRLATGNVRHMSRVRGVPIEDWTTSA
jgi:predicted nucleic acid-binding protein